LAIALPAIADINPGEISDVQVTNIHSTQVTITWNTVHPSSSWVLLDFWNPGGFGPGRKIGRDEAVNFHSVVIHELVPYNAQAGNGDVGQYSYYVASQRTDDGSWASYGGPHTNEYNTVLKFRTEPLNTSGPLSITVVPLGQKNVYAGHDLYVMPTISLFTGGVGSQAGSIAVLISDKVLDSAVNEVHWQVDMLDSLRSYPGGFNPGPGWDGRIYKLTSGPNAGKEYVWGAAQANWVTATQMNGDQGAIRVRVPSSAVPGDYMLSVVIHMYNDGGGTIPVGPPIHFNWPFRVYPPAQFTATPPTTFPPIPALNLWEAFMESAAIGGGAYWCVGTQATTPVASLEYGTFLGPSYALVGSFDANSTPSALQQYNYDGGRIYLQIADYSYNTFGMLGYHDPAIKAYWEHCAQLVLYPYDNWLSRSFGEYINEPNQHLLGTGMYYSRTHEPTAGSALSYVTDMNGPYSGLYGTLDTRNTRIVSYTWDSQIANEASGAHGPWQLSGAAIDIAMAELDMFQQFAVNQGRSAQPEVNYHNYELGLLMEALIDQCELDKELLRGCDPRIPLEIGKTLYALFNNFFYSDIGTTPYNFLDIPMSHVWNDPNSTDVWANLNNLISPAAAWYWAQTSDETIRGYGDAMFASTRNDTSNLTWAPKQFNQVYKWSFDFVRYRSGPEPKATFLPSQNPFEGPLPPTELPLIFSEYACGIDYEAKCQNPTLPAPMVNGNTVTLTWDTIEPATTEVYYEIGPPPSCPYEQGHYRSSESICLQQYGQSYSADPQGVRHHSAVLTGLQPGTLYHYRLNSRHGLGSGVMTADSTFTTQ
jgi:hypothetical protein